MMSLPRLLCVALAVALTAVSAGSAAAGSANPYIVTRDDDPPPGACIPGDCSLREAIIDSNATSAADIIVIPAMHITLGIDGADDTAAAGDLDITDDVTIQGAGPDNTTIDADEIDRVIDIPSATDQLVNIYVSIEGLTLTHGTNSGLHNNGILDLKNVVIFGNTTDSNGGGIENPHGVVVMHDTTVGKNSANGQGGGIASNSNLTLYSSTVWVNNSTGGGGGIWSTGGVTLYRSTVHNNSSFSGNGGGILFEGAPGAIHGSTIADNRAGDLGGGVFNDNTLGTIDNTILSGNTIAGSTPSDCAGTFDGDYNLITDTAGCTLGGAHNINADPMLFPLAFYGGLTQTRAIPGDSPAVNNGLNCSFPDQRGITGHSGNGCDIGSYEYLLLGDMDCSGSVSLDDATSYLRWLSVGTQPICFYLGDLDCDLSFGAIDVLSLVRVMANIAALERPAYCGEIGPFET